MLTNEHLGEEEVARGAIGRDRIHRSERTARLVELIGFEIADAEDVKRVEGPGRRARFQRLEQRDCLVVGSAGVIRERE